MKTNSCLALALILFSLCAWGQVSPGPVAGGPGPVDVGPNSRTWPIRAKDSTASGALSGSATANDFETQSGVVEIATGMNYWDGQQWVPSDPIFEPADDGFVATRLQHKVRLAGDLNTIGAVTLTTRDGITLHSTPVGIGLYDAASGRSVIIGAITNSSAILVSSNRVVYENAFSGVCADVVYTIQRHSFEQDVVITGRLDPADYGFPTNTTRIQIFTEFYGTVPQPERIRRPIWVEKNKAARDRMLSPDLVDEVLGFGEFVLATGRAATLSTINADPNVGGAPVEKKFATIAGRAILIESVQYKSIQDQLLKLPDCDVETASTEKNGHSKKPAKARYAAIPSPRADAPNKLDKTARRTAVATIDRHPGVVIDYIATVGSTVASGFVFKGDTTYLVTGPVVCNGTVTVEGGAVFKFKHLNPATASITLNGTLTCKTSSFRPVIFTAVDDDSVGESMSDPSVIAASGYTTNPHIIYTDGYANPALLINYLGAQNWSNVRFSYCQEAIRVQGTTDHVVSHAQLVNCVRGIKIVSSGCGSGSGSGAAITMNNTLFAKVQFPLTDDAWDTSANFYQCTIDAGTSSTLVTASTPFGATFYNSIFANVTTLYSGSVTISGNYNGFDNNTPLFGNTANRWQSAAPFQSQGAGNYYLAAGSNFRNVGMTGVGSTLLNALKKRTTYPPIPLTSAISANTTLSPQAQRDTDTPDLGYHYDPLDYEVSSLAVNYATLILTNGVAISAYGNTGLWLNDGAHLISEGTPLNRNHISRYNTVQEQPVILAGGSVNNNVAINPYNSGVSPPTLYCRFTDFDGTVAGGFHIYTAASSWTLSSLTLRDCSFNSASAVFAGPVTASVALNNNLFERVDVQLWYYPQIDCYNNLFKGGSVLFGRLSSPNSWFVKDNSFDGCQVTDGGDPLTHGHNAYINGANRLLPNDANDKVLTSLTYFTGALGSYYQSTASPLRNMGSRSAESAGLIYYTTTTDQAREGDTLVDIGYHYVATNCGPIDTVWVDDALPEGAVQIDEYGAVHQWTWVTSNPNPLSGSQAHQSIIASGAHQHYFYNATTTLSVNPGDIMVAYVYLDPVNPPTEIMLQWHTAAGNWEHRAYWGANSIGWGVDGTAGRYYMGVLPAAGLWVRLEVPANIVGLEGTVLDGMAFTLYDGRATWDYVGKKSGNFCYDTNNDGTGDYREGPVVTAPAFVSYTEGNVIFLFLDPDPTKTATVTDPDNSSYNNGWMQVFFAEQGQIEDHLFLYLAANDPAGSQGNNYAAFSNEGNDLYLNGVLVGTIQGPTVPGKPIYAWVGQYGGPVQVAFNANATVATVDALVKNIVYWNGSADPNTNPRVVSILVGDGEGGVSIPTRTQLNVISVNSCPWAYNLTYFTAPDTPVEIQLQARDAEPSQSLSYAIGQQPTYGSLTGSGSTYTYHPPASGSGVSSVSIDTFTYHATDTNPNGPNCTSLDATVTIYMGDGGAPTVYAGPDQTIFVNGSVFLAPTPNPIPVCNRLTWSVVNGPSPVTFYPADIDPPDLNHPVNSITTAAGFALPGVYNLRATFWDSRCTLPPNTGDDIALATDDVSITVLDNRSPKVDAGPDRLVSVGSSVTITGTATDDWVAPIADGSYQWYLLSGPQGYAVTLGPGATLSLVNLQLPGTYIFRLTVKWGGEIGSDEVVIQVRDLRGRTWTRNADFEEGFLKDVTYDEIDDALILSTERHVIPYIGCAFGDEGHNDFPMLLRLDSENGQIVALYQGAPRVDPNDRGWTSRAIADPSGDTWVSGLFRDGTGVYRGFATRYGVVLGGTRGNRLGVAPNYTFQDDPKGEYLRPPYKYNTCVDRDGDGFLHVSGGPNQLLPWPYPQPTDQAYSAAQLLASAVDETITDLVLFDVSTYRSTLALDTALNLWATGDTEMGTAYQKYDPIARVLGAPILFDDTCASWGFSEGVVSRQNILWGSRSDSITEMLHRVNLNTGQQTCFPGVPPVDPHGVAVDPATDNVWYLSSSDASRIFKLDANGNPAGSYSHGISDAYASSASRIVVDRLGNIWVLIASSPDMKLVHMRTDGSVVGIVNIPCLTDYGCMGLDNQGRIWLSGTTTLGTGHQIVRVNPTRGPIGTGNIQVGEVDLSVTLPDITSGFSAITDFASAEAAQTVAETGQWRAVHDSGAAYNGSPTSPSDDVVWGEIAWNSWEDIPHGARLTVQARAAYLETLLSSQAWQTVAASGNSFSAQGQFVEIRVTFTPGTDPGTGAKIRPILYDLTLVPSGVAPQVDPNTHQVAVDDELTITKNSNLVTIDVLANDLGAGLSVSGLDPARKGHVSLQDGQVTYAPPAGFSGEDRFVYTVTASGGIIDRALVRVHVSGSETAPAAHHLDGTLENAPQWTAGQYNACLQFSTTGSQWVKVDDSPLLHLGGNLTIAFWMRKDSEPSGAARLVGKGSITAQNYGVWDAAGPDQHLLFQYHNTLGQFVSVSSATPFPTAEWHHVAVTMADGFVQFYVDGIPESARPAVNGTPVATADPFTIGWAGYSSGFGGSIDEVHVYNRALMDAEVSELSSSPGRHVSTANALIALWNLDEGSGTVAADSSSGEPIPGFDPGDPFKEWREKYGALNLTVDCKAPPPSGHPPVAVRDLVSMLGRALPTDTRDITINVLNNDYDPDPNDRVFLVDDFPRKTTFGHVRLQGSTLDTASLVYQPSVGGYGVDRFNYTIRDKNGSLATGTVTVNVAPVNPPTVSLAVGPPDPLTTPTTLTFTATAVPGAIDTSAFANDFFLGVATGLISPKIVRVEFFDGDRKVGEALSGAGNIWTATWSKVPAGTRVLTAVATDALGLQATSSPAVTKVIAKSDSSNVPPLAAITGFDGNDVAPPPAGSTGPDPAGVNTTRPVIVKTGRPRILGTAYDSSGGDASIYYQLLLFRSDGSLVGNVTPQSQTDGYATLSRPGVNAGSFPNQVDLTRFANGGYELELRVSDGIDETVSDRFAFVLRTGLRMGQFAFQEEDQALSTSGMPVTVSRSYDSSNPWDADFGFGWTFTVADLNVEFDEDRVPAADFFTDEPFSLRVGGGRDVTLTLPDGRRTTFACQIQPENEIPFSFRATWVSEPGVAAKLETFSPGIGEDFGDNLMFDLGGTPPLQYWQNGGPACPIVNYDIPKYLLILEDGTKYTIEREDLDKHDVEIEPGRFIHVAARGKARVTRIERPTGEYFVVTPDAIDHYTTSGSKTRSLYFERGAGNRIVAVRDGQNANPSFPALVSYEYDGAGNLVYVHKLLERGPSGYPATYATTTYVYGQVQFPHYITKIIDPRGVEAARNEYYDVGSPNAGKLWKITDSENRVTTFTYDFAGPFTVPDPPPEPPLDELVHKSVAREIITDNDNHQTKHETDAQGNVLLTVDAKGVNTERWFSIRNNLVKQTIKPNDGSVDLTYNYAFTYDTLPNNPEHITSRTTSQPGGITSREEYNPQGQVWYSVDARYYVPNQAANAASFYTEYEYDSANGNLLRTWTGNAGFRVNKLSENTYYLGSDGAQAGLLKDSYDASRNRTTYSYYTSATDSDGRIGDLKDAQQYDAASTLVSRTVYKYDPLTGNRKEEIRSKLNGSTWASAQYKYDFRNRVTQTTDPAGGLSTTVYSSGGQVANSTDRYGAETRYTYDTMGRLVQTEYPDRSVSRSVTYYAQYPAGTGPVLRHVIQEDRHLVGDPVFGSRTIYDELGRSIRSERLKDVLISFTLAGEVGKTTFTSATVLSATQTTYDFAGRVDMTADASGKWTKNDYDDAGRRWRVRAFSDSAGNYVAGTTITTLYGFDANGNQIWVLDANQYETIKANSYTVTVNGNQVTKQLQNMNAAEVAALFAAQELARLTRYTYDSFNRVTRVDLPSQGTQAAYTESRYDLPGHKWLEIDADRKATAFVHDALNRLIWVVTDVNNNLTALPTGDPASWPTANRNADSTATQYVYDEFSNLTSQIDALGRTTRFQYNPTGQRVKRTLPDSESAERWRYDMPGANGLLHRNLHVDFAGRTTITDFDLSGRVVQKMPASSASLSGGTGSAQATASFNPAGANNALRVTAFYVGTGPNGATIVLIPDDAGIIGNTASASYDAYSQVLTVRYNTASSTALAVRDTINQLSSTTLFTAALDTSTSPGDGASNNGTGLIGSGPASDSTWVTFEYSPTGRRSRMVDNKGTADERATSYAYDENGRLKVKQSPQGTLSYSYDAAGNLTEISARHGYTFPGTRPWLFASANQTLNTRTAGAHMTYTYDSRNRLWQVFADPSQTTLRATYSYDTAGNLSTVAYGNNVTTSYFYDARSHLRYLKALNGATVFATFDYDDYDGADGLSFPPERKLAPSGLRQGLAELIRYSGTDYRRIVAYDNDNLNRLRAERIRKSTGASWPSPWPPTIVPATPDPGDLLYDVTPGYGDASGFDKAGNRHSRTSSATDLVVQGGTAQLNNQTSAGMVYDADDRLNYVASPASYDKNGNALYQSTYVSQTTPNKVASGSGAPDQYDLENRLTQRGTSVMIVYDGDGNRVKKTVGATQTHYLVDDRNPTGYAQVLEEQPTAGATPTVKYAYGLDLINQDRGGTVSYYGYDGQGTVRYLTSTAPAVTDSYTYDAYGILLAKNGTTLNNYLYAGEQWDPELGMYYLRARYYHPDIGRFWSMDTFEGTQSDPLSLHKYIYVANNPVNIVDPSGHDGNILSTQTSISIAFILSAWILSPGVANAPGPSDPVFADYSDLDLAINIVGGHIIGKVIGFGVSAVVRGYSKVVTYVASKRGPVVSVRASGVPNPEAPTGSHAGSFDSDLFIAEKLDSDLLVYRAEGGTSGNFGSFYGLEKPQTTIDAEELANIFKWGNTAQKVVTYRVPKGTTVYMGRVKGGAGRQIFLKNAAKKGVTKVSEEALSFSTTDPGYIPGSIMQ